MAESPNKPPPGWHQADYAIRSVPGRARDPAGRQRQVTGFHSRGRLPHLKADGGTYFVTFRLADSLPQKVLQEISSNVEAAVQKTLLSLAETSSKEVAREADVLALLRSREYFRQLETWLNQGLGSCCLRRDDVAEMIANALLHFNGERYHMAAWCVMPNHVHVVVRPNPGWSLSQILHSWKSFTSKRAAKLMEGSAPKPFWMAESHNHLCRQPEDVDKCCYYTTENPVRAGLCEARELYRWSSAWKG